MDSKSSTVTYLGSNTIWEVQWTAWCSDGLHALVLFTSMTNRHQQQFRVYHVASGRLTASLTCVATPIVQRIVYDVEAFPTGMYMSCKAQAILVPESLQAVSLCRLLSLTRLARLDAPELSGKPTSLLRMGWADHDHYIVMVWQAVSCEVVVTVHSGSDGSLHHMLFLKPHDPDRPPMTQGGGTVLKAFTPNPGYPVAAIAWLSGMDEIHVALIDLTCGTQQLLQRPPAWSFEMKHIHATNGTRYNEDQNEQMDFAWSPGGRFLMVHERMIADDDDDENWVIFTSPSGKFLGPDCAVYNRYAYGQAPIWCSHEPFCPFGGHAGATLDWLTEPSTQLSLFVSNPDDNSADWFDESCFDVDPMLYAFVPGTQDMVHLKQAHGSSNRVYHWVFDASTGSRVCHDVTGFSPGLGGLSAKELAWQPTLKSSAIYALAEQKENAGIHLIDARRHRRLVTWTSEGLSSTLQASVSLDFASLAWSQDGKQLAIVTFTCTIILSFVPCWTD